MNRTNLISFFFLGLLVFIVFQVLWILSPFVTPIFWAAILSFAFYPLHTRLKRRFVPNEAAAAAITTAFVVLAFVPLALFVVINLAGESVRLYEYTIDFIQNHRLEEVLARLREVPFVQRIENAILRFDVIRDNYRGWLLSSANALGNYAALQAGSFTKNLLVLPLNFFLTFFLVFFFLKDGPSIYRFLHDATPLEESEKNDVFGQVTGTFEAVIRGQLLTALAQGALAGLIFFFLGLPLPIFFAALTFIASLIPVVGSPIVWVPFVIWLAASGHYTKAGILLVLGTFGISLIDNFLKPMLIGEKTKLPYLLLFLGILGGLKVYGLMGIFLAPTVLSLFFVLVKIYREKFLLKI